MRKGGKIKYVISYQREGKSVNRLENLGKKRSSPEFRANINHHHQVSDCVSALQ